MQSLSCFFKLSSLQYSNKKDEGETMKIDKARECALKIICEIEEKKAYSNLVLDEYLTKERENLTLQDINFISELVYGVVTWKYTLDCILEQYATIKLKKISVPVLANLRLGIYQIVFLEKIPKSAAVNEAVNLTKKYAYKSTGFVNAILRKVEKEDYQKLQQIEDPIKRIAKIYSMPEWIVTKLEKQYGIEKTKEICFFSNQKPPVTIRINSLKTTKVQLVKKLKEQNIECEETQLEDYLRVNKGSKVAKTQSFKEGEFFIQDEGAGRIGELVEPRPGELILDACSAPGGKTTQLAQIMKNQGKIIAWDIHENRLELVKENAKRLGITIIETRETRCYLLSRQVGRSI